MSRFAAPLLLAFSLLAPSGPARAAENPYPEPLPSERYQQTLAKSPFALATKVEEPAAPQESFAANWNLTGLSRFQDESGEQQDFVTIRSRDGRLAFSLTGQNPSTTDDDSRGVVLVSVNRAEDLRRSTATLKLGDKTARVEFSQESAPAATGVPLGGPGGAPGPGARPGGGGSNPALPGGRPPTSPGLTPGAPGGANRLSAQGRPGIPRPAVGAPGQMGAASAPGGAVPPTQEGHRRIRIIPTPAQ